MRARPQLHSDRLTAPSDRVEERRSWRVCCNGRFGRKRLGGRRRSWRKGLSTKQSIGNAAPISCGTPDVRNDESPGMRLWQRNAMRSTESDRSVEVTRRPEQAGETSSSVLECGRHPSRIATSMECDRYPDPLHYPGRAVERGCREFGDVRHRQARWPSSGGASLAARRLQRMVGRLIVAHRSDAHEEHLSSHVSTGPRRVRTMDNVRPRQRTRRGDNR
jgi:hypothetical protein